MTHSHMPIQHLIRQVELKQEDREKEGRTKKLPGWLIQFIDQATEAIEPIVGVARVGYDCRITEEGWNLSLFLGGTEVMGGCEDGLTRVPDFNLNISGILTQFESVELLRWECRPNTKNSGDELSAITIQGVIQGTLMTLSVLDRFPKSVGPGMRENVNGQLETV